MDSTPQTYCIAAFDIGCNLFHVDEIEGEKLDRSLFMFFREFSDERFTFNGHVRSIAITSFPIDREGGASFAQGVLLPYSRAEFAERGQLEDGVGIICLRSGPSGRYIEVRPK